MKRSVVRGKKTRVRELLEHVCDVDGAEFTASSVIAFAVVDVGLCVWPM
jgi:hypothetical protein